MSALEKGRVVSGELPPFYRPSKTLVQNWICLRRGLNGRIGPDGKPPSAVPAGLLPHSLPAQMKSRFFLPGGNDPRGRGLFPDPGAVSVQGSPHGPYRPRKCFPPPHGYHWPGHIRGLVPRKRDQLRTGHSEKPRVGPMSGRGPGTPVSPGPGCRRESPNGFGSGADPKDTKKHPGDGRQRMELFRRRGIIP
jgi:hypothetical protein